MSDQILEVKKLHKNFGDHQVLKGIDLVMKRGEFFALMGASGSGKSTLLNIIGALISASEGEITVGGDLLAELSDNQLAEVRRNHIAWIFQDFHLIENLTAFENVLIPLNLAGKNGIKAEERAKYLLEKVGLSDRMYHFPDGLSGGQQQRVAIARSLANDPELILADEPTGNLDTQTGQEIIELFRDLAAEGKTVLMVSHDIALAHAAQKVMILKNGEIHEEKELEVIL